MRQQTLPTGAQPSVAEEPPVDLTGPPTEQVDLFEFPVAFKDLKRYGRDARTLPRQVVANETVFAPSPIFNFKPCRFCGLVSCPRVTRVSTKLGIDGHKLHWAFCCSKMVIKYDRGNVLISPPEYGDWAIRDEHLLNLSP